MFLYINEKSAVQFDIRKHTLYIIDVQQLYYRIVFVGVEFE